MKRGVDTAVFIIQWDTKKGDAVPAVEFELTPGLGGRIKVNGVELECVQFMVNIDYDRGCGAVVYEVPRNQVEGQQNA